MGHESRSSPEHWNTPTDPNYYNLTKNPDAWWREPRNTRHLFVFLHKLSRLFSSEIWYCLAEFDCRPCVTASRQCPECPGPRRCTQDSNWDVWGKKYDHIYQQKMCILNHDDTSAIIFSSFLRMRVAMDGCAAVA